MISVLFIFSCLFGEMKTRDAILKGTSEAEQLEIIYKLFGTPTGKTVRCGMIGSGVV